MARKPLILTVEADPDLDSSLGMFLRETDKYEVITANTSKDAFGQLSRNKKFLGLGDNPVRLILLDIDLQDKSSLAFLSELRKDFPPDQVGVIIISGQEDKEKFARAREGNAAGYFLKPFNREELLGAIERFFEGKSKWMIEQTKWETINKEESWDKKGTVKP